MATLVLSRRGNHIGHRFAFLVFCALIIVLFVLPVLNQHALERHGMEAMQVYNTICQKGPEATFQRDNRLIRCVKLDNGKYGAVITEPDCNGLECLITAFKSKYRELSDLARYLGRGGATLKP